MNGFFNDAFECIIPEASRLAQNSKCSSITSREIQTTLLSFYDRQVNARVNEMHEVKIKKMGGETQSQFYFHFSKVLNIQPADDTALEVISFSSQFPLLLHQHYQCK
ncbi:hypothetical protein GQX74_001770 [Glossina fuscipes]|nr:hypothetical protein GQX74_001770 [Glossina fuscipes]